MKLRDIRFPKELLTAQQDGSLVIFAGAGVSMGSPANLPSFGGLVSSIARGTKFAGKDLAPFDKVLGDMERSKVEVRRLSRQILGDQSSKPTRLHRLILELAGINKNNIRIVSTNLDAHFSSVVKERGLEIEEYFAPALPIGSDFNGIVHLHGSVLKPEARYVLTDGDFGKAYLIDGWASRFVKEMFLKYTVLFVGYSHGDIVMNYIARGMPPTANGKRFALSFSANDGLWDSLGITLVEYPLKEGPDQHLALVEGVEEWVRYIAMGVLDHEKQIQQLVSQRPPVDQRDIDYIVDRIFDPRTIQYFWKYAETSEWIFWADAQGLLKDIFNPLAVLDERNRTLIYWLAEKFVKQYPYHLLSLIESKKDVLHPELWSAIASALHRQSDKPMDRKAFAIFIGLLLKKTYQVHGRDTLEYLLEDCKVPEDNEPALSLFIYLTKPFIKLEKKVYVPEEHKDNPEKTLDADLGIAGESHWLTRNWDRIFRNNLAQFGDRLFFALKEHVESGYDLIRPFESDVEKYDSISYQRSAIERHSQNRRLANDFPNLIDCFSDVLEWVASERKDLIQVSISWINSPKTLFKRFAIFIMHKSKFHTPDEKILWLINQDLIFNYHTHHEVFGLLKDAYPGLNSQNRGSLVAQIVKGPQKPKDKEERIELEKYSTFQALSWLQSADPSCSLVKIEIDKIKSENPDYQQRAHANFHSYISEAVWVGSESPHTPDDLIAMDIQANLQTLLSWTSETKFGIRGGRSGLIETIEKAIEKEGAFGFKLSELLVSNRHMETDLWEGILRGWIKSNLSEDDIGKILKLFLNNKELLKRVYNVSDLLRAFVTKKEPRLPDACYEDAMSLAENLWEVGTEIRKEREDVNDWLTAAINHHGGRLAEFWLHLLSQQNVNAGEARFPDRIKKNLEILLSDESYQGKLARVIIASQTLFLFRCAEKWAVKNVISLLDIETNEQEAQRAWDGYLSWGKWSDELLEYIRPLFQKIFKKISALGEADVDRFIDYVAGICLYASVHPDENSWLSDFLNNSTPETRELFSKKLKWLFRNMKYEGRTLAWKKWIKEYWIKREDGRPLRLDNAEKVNMIELSIFLEEFFEEAVDLIISYPSPTLDGTTIYHVLNHDGVGEKYPGPTLKLLIHLLPGTGDQMWPCHDLEPLTQKLVNKLGTDSRYRANLMTLCDLLGQRRCSKAGEIRDSIPTT